VSDTEFCPSLRTTYRVVVKHSVCLTASERKSSRPTTISKLVLDERGSHHDGERDSTTRQPVPNTNVETIPAAGRKKESREDKVEEHERKVSKQDAASPALVRAT
jgi:hypothetical protein